MAEYNNDTVKWMSALAYLSILFFLPLVVVPESEDGKFHANQAFTLLLVGIALGIIGGLLGWIPVLGVLIGIVVSLGYIGCFILAVIGFINGLNQEQKKLPIIGGYTFLK